MEPVSVIRKFQGVIKGGEETHRERERERVIVTKII